MVGQNKKRKNNITNIPTRIQAQTKLKLKLAQHLTQKLFCFTIPIINKPLFQLVINCSTWCRPKYLQILLYESLDIAPNILNTKIRNSFYLCKVAISTMNELNIYDVYDTIRDVIFTCAQKLTEGPT